MPGIFALPAPLNLNEGRQAALSIPNYPAPAPTGFNPNYFRQQSTQAPAPTGPSAFQLGARGFSAGAQAAQGAGQSYDTESALVNIGTSTAAGAASGAAVGGPWGAVIGGGVAAVESSLQAWLQVSAENKRKSDAEKLIAETTAREDAKAKGARQDALYGLAIDRKQQAFQSAWNVSLAQKQAIFDMLKNNQALRERYLKTGQLNARV